jgi:hypothetical protein
MVVRALAKNFCHRTSHGAEAQESHGAGWCDIVVLSNDGVVSRGVAFRETCHLPIIAEAEWQLPTKRRQAPPKAGRLQKPGAAG